MPDGAAGPGPQAGTPLHPADRCLLVLYQFATWVSFSVMDDAAMLAFAFS